MRKILNIVLPLALIGAAVWWTWSVATAGGGVPVGPLMAGVAAAIAGCVWLASDVAGQ